MNIQSTLLKSILERLDAALFAREEYIKELEEEIERLQKERAQWLNEEIKAGHDRMGQTLRAVLGSPTAEGLGPVGVTVMMKIKDMQTIEEVHGYIEQIVKDHQEAMKEKQNYSTVVDNHEDDEEDHLDLAPPLLADHG